MTHAAAPLLIHCRRAPYGNRLAREAIDLALAAAAFDQPVALVFTGAGLWQLLPEQQPGPLGMASHSLLLESLALYDLDRLYVSARDLAARQLTLEQLAVAAIPLEEPELQQLFHRAHRVVNF